jgi:hypothetical protein
MARLNDTKIYGDLEVSGDITTAPIISIGTTSPTTIPAKVGDIYVDTTAGNIYISKGTTNSTDWVQVNN